MITCIIVGAGGRGMDSYAPYIKESKIMKIVGVAEPDERKRKKFCSEHAVSENMAFSDYRELFEKGRLADAVIICTHDRMHLEPTLLAIKCGYHILLEKPVSPDIDELLKIENALKGYNRVFMTGYVLRYTPFIQKIKELIDSDEIGKIMSVQLNENEGYWHHAHSYVRGQWNRADTSAPLIVAKSCHGMGPYECYNDMCHHATMGMYASSASDEYVNYVMPQEHGNHIKTKLLKMNGGLTFATDGEFEFNVSNYTSDELTKTMHTNEITGNGATNIRIDYKVSGIGSNSCGQELLNKYRRDEKEFDFEFYIL